MDGVVLVHGEKSSHLESHMQNMVLIAAKSCWDKQPLHITIVHTVLGPPNKYEPYLQIFQKKTSNDKTFTVWKINHSRSNLFHSFIQQIVTNYDFII